MSPTSSTPLAQTSESPVSVVAPATPDSANPETGTGVTETTASHGSDATPCPDRSITGPYSWMLWVLLGLSVSLGVWLRLSTVTTKSLWQDELWTIQRTDYETVEEVVTHLQKSPFPPVHYVIVYYWRQLCAAPVLGIRGPSVLCGLLAIPLFYLVWKPLIGQRAAMWGVVCVSLSAYHIWSSLDAKMYSAVWLLTCVSHGLFLRLILTSVTPSPSLIVTFILATGVLPLLSYTALAVPVVQGAYLIGLYFYRRESRRNQMLGWMGLCVSLLPIVLWMPYFLESAKEAKGLDWIGPALPEKFWNDVCQLSGLFLCGFREGDHGGIETFGQWIIWFRGLTLISFLVSVCVLLVPSKPETGEESVELTVAASTQGRRCREVMLFVIVGVLIPVLGAFVFSMLARSVWGVSRYLTPIIPLLIVAIAITMGEIRSITGRVCLIVPLMLTNLGMCWLDQTELTRIPWEKMAEMMVQRSPDSGTTVYWEESSTALDASMAFRFEFLRKRELNRGDRWAARDRLVQVHKILLPLEGGFLVESDIPNGSGGGTRDLWTDHATFEKLGSWKIYGTSDLPNPSIVRVVTLWSMRLRK